MSGTEMAGDLVDAALVAGAVDHEAHGTIASDGHTHEAACLNCGAALAGPFCHECGQAAHVHRTLGAFFHDLLHGVFHFEGRIWHSLPLLAFRPGLLTRRYIDGQRARFVSPLALFLFSAFLMFAAIQQTTHGVNVDVHGADGKLKRGRAAIEAQLKQLSTERGALIARHADTEDIDDQIAGLERAEAIVPATADGKVSVSSKIAWIDAIIAKALENPALAIYKVEIHAYKYSWLLIPISVPFVWLLFPFNRRFPLYDHTVFVTYSLSFMTLLIVAVILADALGLETIEVVLLCVPPFHMYRQLRGAYGTSRIGAVVRTVALLVFSSIALMIFTGVILMQSMD